MIGKRISQCTRSERFPKTDDPPSASTIHRSCRFLLKGFVAYFMGKSRSSKSAIHCECVEIREIERGANNVASWRVMYRSDASDKGEISRIKNWNLSEGEESCARWVWRGIDCFYYAKNMTVLTTINIYCLNRVNLA